MLSWTRECLFGVRLGGEIFDWQCVSLRGLRQNRRHHLREVLQEPGYRTTLARAHPLQERDPKLYKRLDGMARLPLQQNKQLWDEFFIEIKAGDFYEHLPILVEILQEGKWRTDALDVMKWLRENFVRRVTRSGTLEDYGPAVNARRRPGGPKFDKRSGALTAFAERPFIEFEVIRGNGDTISPDEAIEGKLERKRLQTAGGEDDDMPTFPMPADRDSLQFLGRLTFAERLEAFGCEELAVALERAPAHIRSSTSRRHQRPAGVG